MIKFYDPPTERPKKLRSFSYAELHELVPHIHRPSEWDILLDEKAPNEAILRFWREVPEVLQAGADVGIRLNQRDLVSLAKTLLQYLEPSLEDQILDSLLRIEKLLEQRNED